MKFSFLKSFFKQSNASVKPRGFTLIVALIFTAVILSVSLSLASVAYNQVILASTAQQSEYAFYNADSALECALYQDQKLDAFDYSNIKANGTFACEGQTTISWNLPAANNGVRTNGTLPTFTVLCSNGTPLAQVYVFKQQTEPSYAPYHTIIYANGFSGCNTNDPQRVERGIEAHYN
jgi:Tfp pilus assembly protein PilE